MSFRFHLLGLAHVPTHPEVSACAFTQKTIKLARMLGQLGHDVVFYGGEGSQVPAREFVQVVSDADRRACYGDYDWRAEFFRHDPADAATAPHTAARTTPRSAPRRSAPPPTPR